MFFSLRNMFSLFDANFCLFAEFPLHRHSPGRDESGRVVAIVKDSGVER